MPCMCGDSQCPSCGAAQGTLIRDWRDTRPDADGLWGLGVALTRAAAAQSGRATLGAPDPASPLGRRHAYDTARQVWDSARATCVECGADCGVSVDHCGRCGYPVCRDCGPLVMDAAGDVTVTCPECRETGSL